MNVPKRYVVICEGKSERAYLLALQSLLDGVLPPPDGWDEAPVRFIPRPEPSGVKTGYYDEVVPAYRREKKVLPQGNTIVWVDSDIYIWNVPRGKGNNGDMYRSRDKQAIPAFFFSYHKFEDFLALHCAPADFRRWKELMRDNGHLLKAPLPRPEYAPEYQKVFPHYSKSKLPMDLVNETGLSNLAANCRDADVIAAKRLYPDGHSFAEFLVQTLRTCYPHVFRGEKVECWASKSPTGQSPSEKGHVCTHGGTGE